MSANDICCCTADEKVTGNTNLTGIRLFKSIVRKVRQKVSESKIIKSTSSIEDLPDVVSKLERVSLEETNCKNRPRSPPKELVRKFFGSMKTISDETSKCGYSSDSTTEKRRDSRVRIRQKVRARSKSNSRRVEKKPKKILRTPPTYIYVRGLSGIPTQRIRVR